MKTLIGWTLRLYQRWISPLLPPACRYQPTCSEYAAAAVATHGVLRGGTLALWRLLRCHPFVKGGYDPVPVHAPRCTAHATESTGHRPRGTQHAV
jgi:putative membrane protein insertion efficiency factor